MLIFPAPIIAQNKAFDQRFFLAGADKPAHGLARWLGCAPYIIIEDINMSDKKTHWPFGGFFLKLSNEKKGTHEYEEYLRNCKESPLTEKEQQEWTESARAAIA